MKTFEQWLAEMEDKRELMVVKQPRPPKNAQPKTGDEDKKFPRGVNPYNKNK